ncbi:MAG: hypothetical protein V7707_01885 [Motiliproteus sp.]
MLLRWFHSLLWLLLLTLSGNVLAQPLTYSRESDREPFSDYVKELVTSALRVQGLNGQLRPSEELFSQQRALTELRLGRNLDLYWTMTSQQREQGLQVLRIPLLKGMLGQRLLVIRKGDQRFDRIETESQLQGFSFGQGHDWPDADILESGGLTVVRSSNYIGIMEMLARQRFDAFPLAINEIWQELDKRPYLDVEVCDGVLLSYLAPVFIFLHPSQQQLGRQLEAGLIILIDSGEFDRIFDRHFGAYTRQAKLADKSVFRFDNPSMSSETQRAMRRYAPLLLLH